MVVHAMRQADPHRITLAIGDGANDVSMLQQANIGMVLATRDLMADLRAADPFRQGGGKLFSKADRSRFLDVLDRVLRAAAAG